MGALIQAVMVAAGPPPVNSTAAGTAIPQVPWDGEVGQGFTVELLFVHIRGGEMVVPEKALLRQKW